jgi:hypothetical protein
MCSTGSGSPTDGPAACGAGTAGTAGRGRGRARGWTAAALAGALLWGGGAAQALDFFTLWQRSELPLNLAAGGWADYRRQALAGGRRTDDLLRIQCLGRDDRGAWILEVVPLVETAPAVFAVVPGEGLRLRLAPAVAERRAAITEVVEEVRLWRDGTVRVLPGAQWRHDPLVTASFSGDFRPDEVEERAPTVRVITGRELTCRQLTFAAADTQAVVLPQGRMVQAARQEVSAAVHADIPLLGLAYVTERIRAESWLEPAGDRRLPPPEVRIEILECLDYGDGATALLFGAGGDGD